MKLLLLLFFGLYFTSCSKSSLGIKIIAKGTLENPASASGITHNEHGIFAIGDNVNYLFELDSHLNMLNKQALTNLPVDSNGVIPKVKKPDFEAIESMADQLYIFGSGSISPTRDHLICVDLLTKKMTSYSMTRFYQFLKSSPFLQNVALNIEALAISGTDFYLFNRGSNHIIQFSYPSFLKAIQSNSPFPTPSFYKINLPILNGSAAGFSGATIDTKSNTILFTASMENTSNAIDDGEILGSFVGVLPLTELKNNANPICKLLTSDQGTLKTKIESISISKRISPKKLRAVLVSDGDGIPSEFYQIELSW
ncbi:hypothetical protein DNU06_00110 [Putridiphycobacter roseus]|uniref:Uncharacterized protein n=1 Tax=Putridiphycobacter roseus TaxID=2219161 RepID=A0A2W1N324_9FLAO|nr:hypothetical protein [Putridiphycobacter roseus]PZE18274.1 hypothetical protein DNU06_00110 [Putridiphycobacter roseus]